MVTQVRRVLIRKGSGGAPERVEIETSAGTGYGEGGWGGEALLSSPEIVLGRSPYEVEAIFEDLTAAGEAPGGLDMALWDAAARGAVRPARELLGKTYRTEVRVVPRLEPEIISAGRDMPLDVLLRDFVAPRLIDLAIPDIDSAGLTGLRRIAYFCWLFRVRLGVSCQGSPLSTAAALHAAACSDGRIAVPDGPGLGVDVVPEAVEAFRTELIEIG